MNQEKSYEDKIIDVKLRLNDTVVVEVVVAVGTPISPNGGLQSLQILKTLWGLLSLQISK